MLKVENSIIGKNQSQYGADNNSKHRDLVPGNTNTSSHNSYPQSFQGDLSHNHNQTQHTGYHSMQQDIVKAINSTSYTTQSFLAKQEAQDLLNKQ